jgi:hypothetical protein
MYVLCISFIVSVPKLFIVSLLTWFNYCFFLFLLFIQGFGSPHDVAVSRDGEALYVVQIGPNSIHKFALEWSTNFWLYIPRLKRDTNLLWCIQSEFQIILHGKKKVYKLYKKQYDVDVERLTIPRRLMLSTTRYREFFILLIFVILN